MKNRVLFAMSCIGLVLALPSAALAEEQEPTPSRVTELIRNLAKPDARLNAVVELADFGPKAAPAVPELIKLLAVKDEDLRLNAALALGAIGKDAVGPLTKAISSKDADVRYHAVWALGLIGPAARDATPTVLQALADPNEEVRLKAIFTTSRLGVKAEVAVPHLVKALDEPSEEVRVLLTEAITKIGKPAVPDLIATLEKGPLRARHNAARVLYFIGPDASAAIPALRAFLLAKENETPQWAATALGRMGKAGIPPLMDGINDERVQVKQHSFGALASVGPPALPIVLRSLKDKDVFLRQLAAFSLGTMQIKDEEVINALAASLDDEDKYVRMHAVGSLDKLGSKTKRTVPQVEKVLNDSEPATRRHAFLVLKASGENLRPILVKALAHKDAGLRIDLAARMMDAETEKDLAIPVLVAALKEKERAFRFRAALALMGAEHAKAVPVLAEALKEPNDAEVALNALSRMGGYSKAAAPAVVELLNSPKADHRMRAAVALLNIGGDSKIVVPGLEKVLKNKDEQEQIRRYAVEALWTHGARAVPVLLFAANDKDTGVRNQALHAITNLTDINGGEYKAILPALVPVMKSDDDKLRIAAIQTIGRMGKPALPVLLDALNDKTPEVRAYAATAIGNLGAGGKNTVPMLLDLAERDASIGVRNTAIHSLVGLGEDGIKPLAPRILGDKNLNTWAAFSDALGIRKSRSPAALPFLLEAVKVPEGMVRGRAALALANYGEDAKAAVPSLVSALSSQDGFTRQESAGALFAIGPIGHAAVFKSLEKDGANARSALLIRMTKLSYRNKDAVPGLIACLGDGSPEVRLLAAEVLGGFNEVGAPAIAALEKRLNDADPRVSASARQALGRIKQGTK